MSRRFFLDSLPETGTARLTGTEAEHLARVLRGQVGDEVTLFDGQGREAAARLVRVAKAGVDLQVLACRPIDRESPAELVLGVALPKGDRQRWLVEKAVELGVARLVPLTSRRGVAQPVDAALDRLRRAVIEASKQCGRNRLMTIDRPQTVGQFSAGAPDQATRWLAHPADSADPPQPMPDAPRTASPPDGPRGPLVADGLGAGPLYVAIGPEGGFTGEEIAVLGSRWQRIDLGPRILRVETAAIAVAAWFALAHSAKVSPLPSTPHASSPAPAASTG